MRLGELCHQRAHRRDQSADTDPGHEAAQPEDGHRLGQRGQTHADREPGQVHQDHHPASDQVADRACAQGSHHDTDQGIAAERTGLLRRDRTELSGVGQQRGDYGAVDHEVVSVEDQGGSGQCDDPREGAGPTGLRHGGLRVSLV